MAQGKSQTQQLNGLPALAYIGVQPRSPQNFFIKQGAPTTNDYRNCYVGDQWLDNSSMYASPPTAPTAFNLWILVSVANKVATWVQTAGTGIVQSVGAGNNITITGSVAMPIVNVSGTTNHSILLGNATGSINNLGVATNGQLPIGSTGADPVLATITAGTGITVTNGAGSITIAATSAGDVTGIGTQDGHTVTPTAGVILLDGGNNLTTTGTVGPNTATISLTGITQYDVQIGGASNSLHQLANGTTGQVLTAQTGTYPIWATPSNPASSCAFFAYNNADIAAFGTPGTLITVPFPATLFNIGANYNTGTYTFTAPNTGYYIFQLAVSSYNIASSVTEYSLALTVSGTSAGIYLIDNGNLYVQRDMGGGASVGLGQTNFIKMTAGDTAVGQFLIGPAMAAQVGISGYGGTLGSQYRTIFSGYQVA